MTKTSNLEVVPKTSGRGDGQDQGAERRRVPRLSLTSEQFRVAQSGKVYPVVDVSTEGVAFRVLDRADLCIFPVGAVITGTLNLRREKYQVEVQVRHVGADLVGCEFTSLTSHVKETLEKLLNPVMLAQELRPIPSGEGIALWYHGPSGTDLLFWRGTDGSYRRFALMLLGNYAQWEDGQGMSTGRIRSSYENSETRGVIRLETMLLDSDPQPDPGKLNVAKTLIMSSNLPQDLKKWCTRHLDS